MEKAYSLQMKTRQRKELATTEFKGKSREDKFARDLSL